MSETVVSADWLADRLGDPAVRVVDVREPWEYEGIGHVPGAVNVPFDEFRGPGPGADGPGEAGHLPGAERFAALLSEAGVDRDDRLVAYDDTHGVFAARFLVTAELYGHSPDRLHLLDADYSAWSRERETSRDAPAPEPTDYEARFVGVGAGPLIDTDAVRAALSSDAVVVDTREPWEYEEGHLPGAVQVDWREFVDEETRGLRPREELTALLAERGVTPDRRVVLYCNTARRISHTYVVLTHLGFADLAFYEGSLTAWEQRGGELETGAAPESEPGDT